ncbi:MAG TPA: hypothetical protein VH599_07295 [Ktedonobacterales bacterium]|jgi:hypothetical protein
MVPSTEHNAHRMLLFLGPSWLSGLVSAVVPVLWTGGAIVLDSRGSALYQGLTGISQVKINTPLGYLALSRWAAHSVFLNSMPLFIFWAVVGCAVYLFAVELLKVFTGAVDLEHRLHYVHADARHMLLDALVRLVIRLLDAASICALVLYVLRSLLPFSLADARSVASHPAPGTASMAAIDTALLAASLMLLTALLRLFAFRTRLFDTPVY